MKLNDIPLFPRAHYCVDVFWPQIEDHLAYWSRLPGGLDMSPDYQREHVWTREQQISYIEYVLRGGEVSKTLTWNCTTWDGDLSTPVELVDGKQRLEAVRSFMRGDLPAFGTYIGEFEDRIMMRTHLGFKFCVCSLTTKKEVLQLYLNINAGGTPHTEEEIARVRAMLKAT